jgi:hypothetical protein
MKLNQMKIGFNHKFNYLIYRIIQKHAKSIKRKNSLLKFIIILLDT